MEPTMSKGAPFVINKYMPRKRFEVILSLLWYTDRKGVECNDGFFHMRKIE